MVVFEHARNSTIRFVVESTKPLIVDKVEFRRLNMPKTLSLCMITKNEEKCLGQCLSSVQGIADEIIIVDTGSTDKTKEIAKKFKAKIYDFKWTDDFSAARNESLRHASKDWILVLDADEIIEKNDLEKIRNAIENENDAAGFSFEQRSYINSYFEGAVKNNSGFSQVKGYPFYISHFLVRLFKNRLGIKFSNRVHELVEDSMREKNLAISKIDVVLHHFGSVKDETAIREKSQMYSRIIMEQLQQEPDNPRFNYQAARMHLGMNDSANALRYFKKTAKLDPHYKLVFSEIAKIYLQMNDRNKAIEYFRKSMNHNPENPSPANNLAVVYMSSGNFKNAKEILEEQLKKHPENKALKYNYQKVMENLKNNE